jgi:alanine racemase
MSIPSPIQEIASPTYAHVSLDAIAHNITLLRSLAGRATIMAVVKADAYGHGARRIAPYLQGLGIERFAVATVAEALELRMAGVSGRILVFAPAIPDEVPLLNDAQIDANVTSVRQARLLASQGFRGYVHLKVDTGMTRVGVATDEVGLALDHLGGSSTITVDSLWTHLATADDEESDFVEAQLERFETAIAGVRRSVPFVHVANSGALLNHRHVLALGDGVIVRPGITIYGLSPSPDRDQAGENGFRPAMRLVSRVSHVRDVSAGTTVSYSRRWTAPVDTRIATIQAGYADGVPRALTNCGEVGLRGVRRPITGTVCMDALMVDVGSEVEVQAGDDAVLFGAGGPSCFEVARRAGTITYEITCRVSGRVQRVYSVDNPRTGSHTSP